MMTFEIYGIKGYRENETDSELLMTVHTGAEAVAFVRGWIAGKEYTESSKETIEGILALEDTDAHIIRNTATFKLIQYVAIGEGRGWNGIRIEFTRFDDAA